MANKKNVATFKVGGDGQRLYLGSKDESKKRIRLRSKVTKRDFSEKKGDGAKAKEGDAHKFSQLFLRAYPRHCGHKTAIIEGSQKT